MGISNNSPTMSYIHISGISVVWNNETYMVQDFATNKKYIYWNSDTPHQLNASNVMPNRSTKQYLVIVNDNGMHTLVPPTNDDFSISFEGNSNQAIRDRIFGLYEKTEDFGNRFVAIEENIEGIKGVVGMTEENPDGTLIDRISKVEQKSDKIDLSVEEISKKYNDDKETNQLREDLNSSIMKLNSTLGIFKSELTDYFKDYEITSEEQVKINTQLEILTSGKAVLEGYVDTVRLIAEKNNQTQDVIALESAKKALQIAHDNLYNNVTNAAIDSIITPTENTIIIDSFAKYNLRINELKNTCDDIIILGLGGTIIDELANISIKSDEIKLSVSKVEQEYKEGIKETEDEISKIDKKYADIILDPDNGIASKVEHFNKQVNGDGGISERLQIAEEKISEEGITQTVKDMQFIKDIESGVETNRQNISEIDQKADSINIKVESKADSSNIISMINVSTEGIKIKADKVNITGFVTFSDLAGTGTTTINGSNITTGTINANLANIININASNIVTGTLNISDYLKLKGTGTRYTLMEKDNYAVYDGGSSDSNRKVVVGFRTVYGGYAPTIMLGYNGTGLHNDNTGATCVTLTHYPMTNNPEAVGESYGSLATRVNTLGNYSALNMYQGGRVRLRSHSYQEFYVENNLKRMQIGENQIGFYYGSSSTTPNVTIDSDGIKVNGNSLSNPVAVFG